LWVLVKISLLLIPSSGLPIAVNVYLLSVEYKNEPELASQMVFWTTLVSTFTIPAILSIHLKG